MRRSLGPVGGPVTVFVLIAVLVAAGLGWVTVAALRVEQAQREAAARAELDHNLRVAVRQLDTRMLSTLTIEDGRPFYHYSSPDPLTGSTAGPTPLLAALFPDWMKLHVQLDPATGWESPQVLSPAACERVADAWPDLPLRNNTADRAAVLETVRDKYPVANTWSFLCARDPPADAGPFAAAMLDPLPPSGAPVALVPPASGPKPPPPDLDSVQVGASSGSFRLLGWELTRRAGQPDDRAASAKKEFANPAPQPPFVQPPIQQQVAQAPGFNAGRANSPDTERQLNDFRNRSGTISRGLQEAKNVGQEFPMYGKGYQQNYGPAGDGKTQAAIGNGPGQPNPAPPGPGGPNPPGSQSTERDKGGRAGPVPVDPAIDRPKEEAGNERAYELLKKLQAEQFRETADGNGNRKPPGGPRLVAPAEDRPLLAQNNTLVINPTGNTAAFNYVGPVGVNIHLGSMRPQWITAADGTETLVLVRAAKLDDKIIYQGVILDWEKLELVLREEVKELLPGARLVPVKDAAEVSPDRAMTALPVQLDPGPQPELPPAGWTTLRMGLVLAWVAALVAFAAVGFSGWSLIDLAERRIRFVSAVTHELRTPLTSLRLYLDLLMSGMIHDEAKRQEYLNTLATESDRLHRLIDNVLDFAKLEKRAKNGSMAPLKVSDLVEQLRSTWTDRVAADGKELVVVSTLPAEAEVCTDATMVHQIVGNLIDNARKYTRDAEDKRIWLWAKPGGAGRVVFEVEDRGAGVEPGERKTIFKPFRRGEHADTRAGGAGLGLALAKQWAEVLGGTLSYRPAEGAPGACFRLELPVK